MFNVLRDLYAIFSSAGVSVFVEAYSKEFCLAVCSHDFQKGDEVVCSKSVEQIPLLVHEGK